MSIELRDLNRWIDECIKDDEGFHTTKSLDPEVEMAKTAIKEIIMKLRGRIF